MKISHSKIIATCFLVALIASLAFILQNSKGDLNITANLVELEQEEAPVRAVNLLEQALLESDPVDEAFLEELKAEHESTLGQPNIAKEDILRGWYEAEKTGKRYGTPENWVYSNENGKFMWGDPYVLKQAFNLEKDRCHAEGGSYIESCVESTEVQCEFIESSHCSCPKGEKWDEKEGCMVDELILEK